MSLGYLDPRLCCISEESVMQAERKPFNTKNASSFVCLLSAHTAFGKLSWFTISEINQQHSLSLLREFSECSAHL